MSHKNPKVISLKVLMAFIGIFLISVGSTLLLTINAGLDPFTAFNTAVAHKFNMGLGNWQLIVNLVLFIFVVIFDRKLIGIGTILNMVLIGFEIQYLQPIFQSWVGQINIWKMLGLSIIGLLVFTFGASMYMEPKLGISPYDAIAPIIVDRTNLKYRHVRIAQDCIALVLAFLVKGPIGYATIIVAFFTGPLISFWSKYVSDPIVKKINLLDK